MILWKINDLKRLLATHGLSQKVSFRYLLLFALIVSTEMELVAYFPYESPNIWTYITTISCLACQFAGIAAFYAANGGPSGKNLFERYIGISVVVTIRFIPLIVLLIIALTVYQSLYFGAKEVYPTTLVEALLTMGVIILFWVRMVKHVKDVANA
jgi:hypothetical protein